MICYLDKWNHMEEDKSWYLQRNHSKEVESEKWKSKPWGRRSIQQGEHPYQAIYGQVGVMNWKTSINNSFKSTPLRGDRLMWKVVLYEYKEDACPIRSKNGCNVNLKKKK